MRRDLSFQITVNFQVLNSGEFKYPLPVYSLSINKVSSVLNSFNDINASFFRGTAGNKDLVKCFGNLNVEYPDARALLICE